MFNHVYRAMQWEVEGVLLVNCEMLVSLTDSGIVARRGVNAEGCSLLGIILLLRGLLFEGILNSGRGPS